MKSILKSHFEWEDSLLDFQQTENEIWVETNMMSLKEYLKFQKDNILYQTYPNQIFEDFRHHNLPDSKCLVVWEINFSPEPLKNKVLQLQKDFAWFATFDKNLKNKEYIGIIICTGDRAIIGAQIGSLAEEFLKLEGRKINIFILHQESFNWEMAKFDEKGINNFVLMPTEMEKILKDLDEDEENKKDSVNYQRNFSHTSEINQSMLNHQIKMMNLSSDLKEMKKNEKQIKKELEELKIKKAEIENERNDLKEKNTKLAATLDLAQSENILLKSIIIYGFLAILFVVYHHYFE